MSTRFVGEVKLWIAIAKIAGQNKYRAGERGRFFVGSPLRDRSRRRTPARREGFAVCGVHLLSARRSALYQKWSGRKIVSAPVP
jgi:hypothetical protein